MPDDDNQSERQMFQDKALGPSRVKGVRAMTGREHAVCRMMIHAGDDPYEKTARALGIEAGTVRKHMKSVRTKVGFKSTMGVLIWLQRWYHLTAETPDDPVDQASGADGGLDRGPGLTLVTSSRAGSVEGVE